MRDLIMQAMESDDSYNPSMEANMKRLYLNASEDCKRDIDDIFIHLCGYSFKTILSQHEESKKL